MPHTKNGKYYKIVNGKKHYNAKYDRPAARMITGRGSYNNQAVSTYKRTRSNRRAAKAAGNYEQSLGRTMLKEGGSMLGGLVGMPGLGKMAGGALSNIFGLGTYEVKDNIFMEGRLPQVTNVPSGGGTVIRYQEYLGDIITSSTANTFKLESYDINAANEETFPFLSAIAARYEQYEFEGLLFEFRSTSADALNSTNTALGSVIMSTEYNAANPAFTSKAQMLNHEYSQSIKPSDSCMHMIECAKNQTVISNLYTLNGAVPAGQDPRLYFLGKFQIATMGFQGTSVNIGELHVTYQVRLMKPQLPTSLESLNDYALIGNSTYTNTNPLGSGTQTEFYNNCDVSIGGAGIIIPQGALIKQYIVDIYWNGTSAIIAYPAVSATNCTILSGNGYPQAGATASSCFYQLIVKTLGNSLDALLSFSIGGTLPSSGTSTVCRIMEIPQV